MARPERFLFRAAACAFLLSSAAGGVLHAQETIVLSNQQARYTVGRRGEYLIDARATLTLPDLASETARPAFKAWEGDVLNLGYAAADTAVWVRFSLEDQDPERTWLLKTDVFDDVRVYFPLADGGYKELRLSRQKAVIPGVIRRYGYYYVEMPRLKAGNGVYLRYLHNDTINIHLDVMDIRLLLTASNDDLVNGAYYGLIIFMVLYNFLLFLLLKDSSYVYYSLYVLNMLFLQIVISGMIMDVISPPSFLTVPMAETVVTALAMFFYIQFVRKYLLAKIINPKVDKALAILALASGAQVLSVLFVPYLVRTLILSIFFFATLAVIGVLVASCIRRKYTPVRYYIISCAAIISGTLAFLLRNLGLLPNVFFTEFGMQIGSSVEAALLAFGLAYRINLLQREKARADEWGRSNLERAERVQSDYQMLFETAPLGIALFTLEGQYVAVNNAYRLMYERPNEEFRGKDFFTIVYPKERCAEEKTHWENLVAGPQTGIASFERANVTATGKIIQVRYFLNFTKNRAGAPEGVLCCVDDTTDLRLALNELGSSVRQKDILLKEVHHRVKNNLQIIISLFRAKLREIGDERTQAFLEATAGRIRTIANVHNRIYLSKDVSRVDVETFIPSAVKQALSGFHLPEEQCHVVYSIQPANLSVDTALPLSLILNELITNCVNHGFNGRDAITIQIRFKKTAPENQPAVHLLEVTDTGKGFPPEHPTANFESFGLNLVENLVTQLGGSFTLTTAPPTRVEIQFSEKEKA